MILKDITVNISSQKGVFPASQLVQVACQFESSIYLNTDDKHINAKSMMGMMSLNLITGKVLTVSAQGSDEAQAVKEIEAYLTAAQPC